MAKKIRTFVGIPLPAGLQKSLTGFTANDLAPHTESVRWTSQDLLHLTLVFIGDVEDARVHDACQAVRDACEALEPFVATVRGAGAFPKPAKPQVLWAGIDEGSESIIALRKQIAENMDEARFRFDWKFQPHITLGRVNRGRFEDQALIEQLAKFDDRLFGEFVVDKVIAYSSTLEKGAPVYVPLATVRLTG